LLIVLSTGLDQRKVWCWGVTVLLTNGLLVCVSVGGKRRNDVGAEEDQPMPCFVVVGIFYPPSATQGWQARTFRVGHA
jgi:hypothetical protein